MVAEKKHKRAVRRSGDIDPRIVNLKIRLSHKDKNLISLFWLLEIVLTAIVSMDAKFIPEHKKTMYETLRDILAPMLSDAKLINDRFNNEINKVFGEQYQNTLADLSIAIITLMETMKPEAVKKVLTAAGISNELIIKNWEDEKNENVTSHNNGHL